VPSGLLSKVKSLFAAIADFLKELPDKFQDLFGMVRQFLGEKISGTRERIIFICCAAAVGVLILTGIIFLISGSRGSERTATATGRAERVILAPEELFLPREPDFIPGVQIEREQRSAWTADDAAQYWQDPLKDGEEPWREQIEKVVDELMERVP